MVLQGAACGENCGLRAQALRKALQALEALIEVRAGIEISRGLGYKGHDCGRLYMSVRATVGGGMRSCSLVLAWSLEVGVMGGWGRLKRSPLSAVPIELVLSPLY